MKRLQYLLAIVFLLAAPAAHTAGPIAEKSYIYHVEWGGFHVASLIVGFERQGNEYHTQAVIYTYGLARTATRYGSESDAKTYVSGDTIKPVNFTTGFTMRKVKRHIALAWDDAVNIKLHTIEPEEKPGKRTPVSKAQKSNAYDPLSAYFVARRELASGKKFFVVPVFDGRRRSELRFKVIGTREDGSLHITMNEIFLAGYTGREQEDRQKRDITVHAYLDPETLIPIGGMGDSVIGRATGKLVATCDSFRECLDKED